MVLVVFILQLPAQGKLVHTSCIGLVTYKMVPITNLSFYLIKRTNLEITTSI